MLSRLALLQRVNSKSNLIKMYGCKTMWTSTVEKLYSHIPDGFKNFYPKQETKTTDSSSSDKSKKNEKENKRQSSSGNNNKNNRGNDEDPHFWKRAAMIVGVGSAGYVFLMIAGPMLFSDEKYTH
jgi:hypothetical protein